MIINEIKTPLAGKSYPWLVISLCAGFLFYKYILQIYPSIITNQLMQEFDLTGAGLGNLAATFYYSYMVTQLFVGILLDKYSTRWLTSLAILSCALGLILFAEAHSLLLAQCSRILMGAGVAFATVAYMKSASVWFSARHYAFVGGLLATAAMAGAVFGQAPLSFLFNQFGWRESLYYIGLVGLILAVLFLLIVRDRPEKQLMGHHTHFSLHDIVVLFKNKQNWLLTCYGGLAFSPIAIFGGLWGNPFLQEAYQINATEAAAMLSLIFIGLGIGSPVLGMLSDAMGNRKQVMIVGTLLSFFSLLAILYLNTMPIWLLSIILFIFGFFLGVFMLAFTIGKEINNPAVVATVIALINTSDALLDALTEPAIGKLLDLLWDGKIINGIHYFSLQSYQIALSVLPLYLFLAVLSLLWIKEASGNNNYKID